MQNKFDAAELEELRELRNDIERKDKQQAGIIEHQVCARALCVARALKSAAHSWAVACIRPWTWGQGQGILNILASY
jgi:hypothetical protein